jgi:hypothetical protein
MDDKSNEIALGIIGVILAVGLLKANEMFDFFDRIDLFKEAVPGAVVVRGRELMAAVGFAAIYVIFMTLISVGVWVLLRDSVGTHGPKRSMQVLAILVWLLLGTQALAMAASYSHAMHRYGEAVSNAKSIKWDFGI